MRSVAPLSRLAPLGALALLVGFAMASCARPRGHGEGAPAPDPRIELDVANHTWNDVDVFILYENTRTRVGSVTSQDTEAMQVPSTVWAAGQIQIRVEPLAGGPVFVTDPISVRGGERIRLSVEHQVGLSHWTVEDRSYEW